MRDMQPHHPQGCGIHVVLFEPEIPPNTGNIIRLCANSGAYLHLIEPVAFELDDKRLRRAGLDYGEWKDLQTYANWEAFLTQRRPSQLYAISTKGRSYVHQSALKQGDYVVFGPESRGLPQDILATMASENILRIPMLADSRSMNLANAVSVVVYEAWRQLSFCDGI